MEMASEPLSLGSPAKLPGEEQLENVAVAQFTVNLARRIFSALPLLDCARVRRLRSRARCVAHRRPFLRRVVLCCVGLVGSHHHGSRRVRLCSSIPTCHVGKAF